MSIVSDPKGAARRFGFVSILWTIAAAGAVFDTVQNHRYTLFRIIWIVVSIALACFFSFTWWRVKKDL